MNCQQWYSCFTCTPCNVYATEVLYNDKTITYARTHTRTLFVCGEGFWTERLVLET